jgi:hypothetical protein
MQAQFLSDFQRLVSFPRYDAFRDGGTDVEALARYLWNTALCESLYPVFQILEVGFRNAVHSEIGIECGEPDWLLYPPKFLQLREVDAISQAITGLRKEQKPVDEPRMVAKLNFGFWTCLLDKPYDQLWHKMIRQVVPLMPRRIRTRQSLSSHLHSIRKLRNLAFHHLPHLANPVILSQNIALHSLTEPLPASSNSRRDDGSPCLPHDQQPHHPMARQTRPPQRGPHRTTRHRSPQASHAPHRDRHDRIRRCHRRLGQV